ncbi:hypothetical protein [Bacillus sp. ISL-57]|uniref:hypothetical protein n=1 Tax=Bacillus sp. ISL-57 TaxID=2819135 RepID=UPI001BE9D3A5|nr:hypothetical protein [Bacillus sp. ISL-57]MBT2718160.1 hypothetical protein [Bacillus sp. ISL-57]
MKYLIWPISLFIAEYFSMKFPVYYGLRIQLYIYIIFILISLVQLKGLIPKSIFNKKVIGFISVLLVMQLISMILSYYRIEIPKYNKNPIITFIGFVGFIGAILVHYLVIKLNIRDIGDVKKFLRSGRIALAISFFVCLVQLFYIFIPFVFEPLVSLIGSTLEARWGGKEANLNPQSFYKLGSYVQTTLRINGLTEEASNLATQFFVVFSPFLIASIKNKYNVFSNNKKSIGSLYCGVFLIIVLLIMAKTTSGFLFAAIILLLLFKEFSKMQKIFIVLFLTLIVLILISSNYNITYISNVFNDFIVNKSEDSVNNRSASTIALGITLFANFIFGVGFEYHSYYIYKYWPEWANFNYEYFLWEKQESFPILSNIMGMFAEYGTIIMIFVIIYVIKRVKILRRISEEAIVLNISEAIFIKTLYDSAKYYFVFLCIGLLFSFVWFTSIYLILFFFFVSIIPIIEKHLNNWKGNNK